VAVDQANRAVGDSIVRAPFAGEVAERSANVGEYVTPQRAVVVLVKVNPLRMELQIAQERIAFVRPNQAVELRVDAFPDRVFRGTIRYISAAVRTDTRSLVAEALVPNEGGVLRPGLFATARVDLGQRRQAVLVPQRAVVAEAGTNRVFVLENGRASERVVSVAERLDNDVVLERGVNAGERVLVDNLDRLSDGARVQDLSQTP
jgi:membrane fusion protein (multidrug efflux system)